MPEGRTTLFKSRGQAIRWGALTLVMTCWSTGLVAPWFTTGNLPRGVLLVLGLPACVGAGAASLLERAGLRHDLVRLVVLLGGTFSTWGMLFLLLFETSLRGRRRRVCWALCLGLWGAGIMSAVVMRPAPRYHVPCAGNLKQIGLALRMYSGDNEGHFPPDLYALVEHDYLSAAETFLCPALRRPRRFPKRFGSREDFVCDYWYRPGFTEETAGSETGVALDKLGNHERFGSVVFGDSHVKMSAGEDWYLNAGLETPPPRNARRSGVK